MFSEPKKERALKRILTFLKTPVPVIGIIVVVSLTVVTTLYSIVLINKDAMKALIQAEATIFGFFGIIVTYSLKVLDDQLESRKKELRELDKTGKSKEIAIPPNETWSMLIEGIIIEIRHHKKRVLGFAYSVGTLLVISMLLSIWSLGAIDIVLESNIGFDNSFGSIVILAGGITLLTFFLAVYFLLGFFKDITEQT